jgi:membrane protein YqaA with SNARE-associated domain
MTEFLDSFLAFILSFGLLGILVLAILDSTFFFYLPFAMDTVLIVMISKHRDMMPVYVIISILGSIAGCVLTYYFISKASEETIEKKFPKKKFKKVKKKIKENGFVGLILTSLLPPPFPFTPFVVAAAVTKFPKQKAFGAISIGRSMRYFGEGILALLLGRQIIRLLESQPFKIFMLGLFLLAAVGTTLSIYRWVRR